MTNLDQSKPAIGQVIELPATVKSVWSHVTIMVASVMSVITAILAVLVQLQELPFLPTNLMAWIAVAVAVLTQVVQVYQKLFGAPAVTPTIAAKLAPLTQNGVQ